MGYEAEATEDDVLAKYFDNEDFLGKTAEKVERKIDFLWKHESPVDAVNDEHSNAEDNEGKKKSASSWLESYSGNMRKGIKGDSEDVDSKADKIVSD